MGLLDSFKAFVHSITTDDHYASYDSPYRNSSSNDTTNPQGSLGNGSSIRLNNDLNGSQYSLENPSASAGFYRPGMKSSQQDLPLQNLSSDGQPPLPSIDSLWDRIEYWIEQEYPELEDNLNDGVTTADLNEFIQDLQIGNSKNLPDDFREFYKRHDGQLRGGKPTGLIMGLVLLDLEAIIEEKMLWTKVAERLETQYYMAQHQQRQQSAAKEGSSSSSSNSNTTNGPINNSFIANQRSVPPNSIQPYYYHKGWVVLLKDNIGNQIAMDLSPGPNGKWGQIILFGRDFDTKLVIASSLQEFIFGFVTDLEQGNFQIDSSEYQEQLGYLSNDRNGDYMIGDEDEDQGELSYWDKDGQEFGKNVLRGRLNYIEVLKRRALKKYGLSETFETTFVPQRQPKKQPPPPSQQKTNSGAHTPILSQSRNVSTSNLKKTTTNGSINKPNVSSPLAAADTSSSSFTVPKETIIDKKTNENKQELEVKEKEKEEEAKVEEKEQAPVEDKKEEEPAEEVKSEEAPAEVSKEEVAVVETPANDETKEEEEEEEDKPEDKEETKSEDKEEAKEEDKDETKEVTDGLKEVEL